MNYYFLILFFTAQIVAMEKQKDQPICWLALLPKPIQNQIVSYIEFATQGYETSVCFKNRLLDPKRIVQVTLNKNCQKSFSWKDAETRNTLFINEKNSLLLKKSKQKFYLIKSGIDETIFNKLNPLRKKKLDISNQVELFSVSEDRTKIVALVDCKEIQVRSIESGTLLHVFNLDRYYEKEGLFELDNNASQIDFDIALYKNYFTKKSFDSTGVLQVSKDWYNFSKKTPILRPVTRLAVANDGKKIAFTDEEGFFVVDFSNNAKLRKIHEVKRFFPMDIVVSLDFNKQSSKFGFTLLQIYPFIKDCTKEDAAKGDEFIEETLFKICLHKGYDLQSVRRMFQDNLLEIKDFEKITSDLPFPFEFFPVDKDVVLMTLADYLVKKGVCKKFGNIK